MTAPGDPFRGLHPATPPAMLRERVLAAARAAAADREAGVLSALLADRALRWCAVALVALAIAHAAIDGPSGSRRIPSPKGPAVEGIAVPGDTGLTAADQMPDLAPLLETRPRRTNG